MSAPMEIVLIVAAVGYVLARRLMGEPADAKRMLLLPAVLTVIGLTKVAGEVSTPLSLVFLILTAAISVAFGVSRGASVRVFTREGFAFMRYTAVTLALWAGNVAVKFGVDFLLRAVDPADAGALGDSLLFTIGIGILAEGLVVCYRALRNNHRVMWTKGKHDAEHETSPALDNLRHSLTGRGDAPYRAEDPAARWSARPNYRR